MDFFGDVATFLDDIIPEDGGEFFETALSRLGSGLDSMSESSSTSSGGSSSSATDIYNKLQQNSNSLAVKEALRRKDQVDPVQSVDPRAIQQEWFERLATFSKEV